MKLTAQPSVSSLLNKDISKMVMFALLSSLMMFADISFAQTAAATGNGACSGIVKFFSNIEGLLKLVSISVVTIAVIFAGYQIAFAHKRISDVAPILIGGLLIGAAGQIATMLLASQTGSCSATAMLDVVKFYA